MGSVNLWISETSTDAPPSGSQCSPAILYTTWQMLVCDGTYRDPVYLWQMTQVNCVCLQLLESLMLQALCTAWHDNRWRILKAKCQPSTIAAIQKLAYMGIESQPHCWCRRLASSCNKSCQLAKVAFSLSQAEIKKAMQNHSMAFHGDMKPFG